MLNNLFSIVKRRLTRDCCIKCSAAILFIMVLITTLFLTSLTITSILSKRTNQQWEDGSTLELLNNDTILVYKGKLPVQLELQVEIDPLNDFHVTVISIDCEELKSHESTINVPYLHEPISKFPTMVPSGYYHYELGSYFKYNISLIGAPNSSELTMRILNNTYRAEEYMAEEYNINIPTSPSALKKTVFEKVFKDNDSTSVPFYPSVASYYIPTFVAPAETYANISYFVTRKYYVFRDYVTFTQNCQLNFTERSCYFKSSNDTENCIIAYYAPTPSTHAARILLTTSITKSSEDPAYDILAFITFLCISIVGAFIVIAGTVYITIKCCKKYRGPTADYQQVPLESCGPSDE